MVDNSGVTSTQREHKKRTEAGNLRKLYFITVIVESLLCLLIMPGTTSVSD